MANNDEYNDQYNDEYLGRDIFVGFSFWWRLSLQISEFRVRWVALIMRTDIHELSQGIFQALDLQNTCLFSVPTMF